MAKLSKKQKAAQRFLDVLEQRQDEFAAIENDRALSIRRMLERTRRKARKLISEHQTEFAKSGKYLTGTASLQQAQATAQDITTVLRRDFMRAEDRLISFKEDAFTKGVWDFDVASQELPDNIKGRLAGSFSQIMPEAAYAAAEHPVMGIGPAMTFNGIQAGTEQRVRNVLTEAVLSGASIQDTTAILNQSLNVSMDAAERIARTSLNASYNEAHKMIYDSNPDIFSGYRWDAVMDDRVSAICIMLHGQFWALGDVPPGPPAHWNCRSILTPVFRDPTLNRMMMNDTVRVRNYTADGKEKIGWARNRTSAQTWLRKQPTSVTRSITGSRTKNVLFRTGKIDMEDIVSPQLVTRTDKSVLRRAWSKNPTDKAVAKMAHANGVHKAPKWKTILKEDRALANKQAYDQGMSLTKAEAKAPGAPGALEASPEQVVRWQDDLAKTENEMWSKEQTVKQLRVELRDASQKNKAYFTRRLNEEKADYARLRNKKWRINKKIKQAGGPPPELPPPPVVDPAVAQLEVAWKETADELIDVRTKLKVARTQGNVEQIALLKKNEARLINKRWRRWKRLPPDSQLRLKTGVKPKPPVPELPVRRQVERLKTTAMSNRDALQNYSGDSSVYNQPLRSGTKLNKHQREVVTRLDDLATTDLEGQTYYRIVDKDFVRPDGTFAVDQGFVSTTKSLDKIDELISEAGFRRKDVAVLEMRVVGKVKGIDVNDVLGKHYFDWQKEVLIQRGAQYRYRGLANNRYVVDVLSPKKTLLRVRLTSKQKFVTGVDDVKKLNTRIVTLRDKPALTLGEGQELKALQASRTRAMNKLRALRRVDNKLPDLPASTRLPKAVKPKVVKPTKPLKPGAQVQPDDVQIQFSPGTQKLQQKMVKLEDEHQKFINEFKALRKKTDAANREKWIAKAGSVDYNEAQILAARLEAQERTLGASLRAAKSQAQKARKAFQKKAAVERSEALGSIKKPKFIKGYDKAIDRAKAELNAMGLDLKTLQSATTDPEDLLQLLANANGQGPGTALTPLRQRILDNFEIELKRLYQWTPKNQKKLRLVLASMDESLLQNPKLDHILFQYAPKKRASANRLMNLIKIDKGEKTHTIVHEFAHHVSYRNGDAHRRTVRWQRARTVDDKLTTIYKGTDEVGKKDKFWDKYVGKIYDTGFEEGTTMGLQTLVDPKTGGGWGKIIKKDPDHFYLMWALLRGY